LERIPGLGLATGDHVVNEYEIENTIPARSARIRYAKRRLSCEQAHMRRFSIMLRIDSDLGLDFL
jgi:hypothetical protein